MLKRLIAVDPRSKTQVSETLTDDPRIERIVKEAYRLAGYRVTPSTVGPAAPASPPLPLLEADEAQAQVEAVRTAGA